MKDNKKVDIKKINIKTIFDLNCRIRIFRKVIDGMSKDSHVKNKSSYEIILNFFDELIDIEEVKE